MQGYVFLTAAIVAEVFGTTCMKLSKGFTKLMPSILVFVGYAVSLVLLTYALKRLDVSSCYAIWSGVDTALIAAIGFTYFHETVSFWKITSLCLIIAGVVGLHLSGSPHQDESGEPKDDAAIVDRS